MLQLALNNFKRFWIGGIIILILLILLNPLLVTDASPLGIADHQAAGSAYNVNAIQNAWVMVGVIHWAKLAMIVDLLFISTYSFGAMCGGILLRHDKRRFISRVGSLVIASSIIFFVTDYAETIAQVIQLFEMQGSDSLANLAASVGPAKNISFLITLFAVLGIIIWDKFKNKA